MSLRIDPDPARSFGGYARLRPTDGMSFDRREVFVSVHDSFRNYYLTAHGHWHADQNWFGPYFVAADGAIVVGPELVNYIPEYAAVTLSAGGLRANIRWPDTIPPAPDAPPIGKVFTTLEDTETAVGKFKGSVATQGEDEAATIVVPTPVPPPPVIPTDPPIGLPIEPTIDPIVPDEAPMRRRMMVPLLLILLLVVLAAAAGWNAYYRQPVVDPAVVQPDPAPAPVADACTPEALRALGDDFGAAVQVLSGCAGRADKNIAFDILSKAEKRGDAAAMLAFGHLYNPDVLDPVIEGQIGLTMAPRLSTALSYYARAAAAGSTDAAGYRDTLCAQLATSEGEMDRLEVKNSCPAAPSGGSP